MRQMKFRAWSKKRKVMYYLADSMMSCIHLEMNNSNWGVFDSCIRLCGSVDDSGILEQFTGLLDKNGKEIYEGDIVKKHDHMKECNGATGVVAYLTISLGEFGIDIIKGNEWSFYYPDGNNFSAEDLEVIGNIYENSELSGESK